MVKKSTPPHEVVDLSKVREDLRIPTQVVAHLSALTGAVIVSKRPGLVEVDKGNQRFLINVSEENIYANAIKAYQQAGLPVPDRLFEENERWLKIHGK